MTTFGENADNIYVIVKGRVALSHPTEKYVKLLQTLKQKGFKERSALLTNKEVVKLLREKTYITSQGGKKGLGDELDSEMRN